MPHRSDKRLSSRIDVLYRICSEFAEMPGLQLTIKQAQRLWGLDESTCVQALNMLVDARFLRCTEANKYGRATDGPVRFPRLKPAQAQIQQVDRPADRRIKSGGPAHSE
jgi:hypothetical protein